PWIKVGVDVTIDPDEKKVILKGEIPLGRKKIDAKDCKGLVVWWDIECWREVPITVTIDPLIKEIEKHEQLFLYFDYAKDTLRRDPKGGAVPTDEIDAILRGDPKIGTARLNKRALERLEDLVSQGFWLSSVDGYTSPEGLRKLPGAAAKSQGN